MRVNKQSMLVAGVPAKSGTPIHIEHEETMGMTVRGNGGQVLAIHTGPDVLLRVHELMHALHTTDVQDKAYAGVTDIVRQIVEDVRLHHKHWRWPRGRTPEAVSEPCIKWLKSERRALPKLIKKEGAGSWPVFAQRFRNAIVMDAIVGNGELRELKRVGLNGAYYRLARKALQLIEENREGVAARMIERAFFEPPPPNEQPPGDKPERVPGDGDEDDTERDDGMRDPPMTIVELPHTVAINEANIGYRLATSGARLHRPSLRKPVLPQRLFIRRAVVEPQGTILIDASGSMGSFDQIGDWCAKAPFATVAYYAGEDHEGGTLFVFARDGMRASEPVEPNGRDNTIDGPALDWLLRQPGPRIFVTDREFCGAADSAAQIVRLERLEAQGEVVVQDYL